MIVCVAAGIAVDLFLRLTVKPGVGRQTNPEGKDVSTIRGSFVLLTYATAGIRICRLDVDTTKASIRSPLESSIRNEDE